jgi:hypothetical protein
MRDKIATTKLALLALLAGLGAAGAAQAHDEHRESGARHEAQAAHHELHGGHAAHDLHRYVYRHEAFRGYGWAEPVGWRAGRWDHRCRAGRCGWWWWADGRWYFYERPVYPYPPLLPGVSYVAPAPGVAVVPAPVYAPPY